MADQSTPRRSPRLIRRSKAEGEEETLLLRLPKPAPCTERGAVILPEKNRIPGLIRELGHGQQGWIMATALLVDGDGGCWVDVDEPYDRTASNQFPFLVKRDEAGWLADLSRLPEARWIGGDVIHQMGKCLEPVIRLIFK